MNPPMDEIELKPEKLGEEKDGGPLFHCDLYDTDLVHKIAVAFLPGLASACIDNTTGGLLKTPASVAVDIRREMVDYLIQRSENFVAESVVLEGGPGAELSDNPYDIIADFVEDFASSKRNFFSRVSGWMLSEKREDWIDDFVQEMEINGFWLLNRRNAVAQTLLKNVDMKNVFHCSSSFKFREDMEEHKLQCGFRAMGCSNEGCNARFSAAQLESHDSVCPFKILPCEQNCPDSIMRRVMDRHCVTVCPMKLVKCPFNSVGCLSTVPHCKIDQHRSEELPSHLSHILRGFHKEASEDDLKDRQAELEKLSSPGKLESARDARSLTILVKDLEAKLGPMKLRRNAKPTEDHTDLSDEKVKTGLPIKEVESKESLSKKEVSVESFPKGDQDNSSHRKAEIVESPANSTTKKEMVASVPLPENANKSALQKEEGPHSPKEIEVVMEKSSKQEVGHPTELQSKSSDGQREEGPRSPKKVEVAEKLFKEEVAHPNEVHSKSSVVQREEDSHSPKIVEVAMEKSLKDEVANPIDVHSKLSAVKREESPRSPNKVEVQTEKLSKEVVHPTEEHSKSSAVEREEGPRSTKKVEVAEKLFKEEVAHPNEVHSKSSVVQREEDSHSPKIVEVAMEKSLKDEVANPIDVHSKLSAVKREESPRSPNKVEVQTEKLSKEVVHPTEEHSKSSAVEREEGPPSTKKVEVQMETPSKEQVAHPTEVHSKSPTKQEEHAESVTKKVEVQIETPSKEQVAHPTEVHSKSPIKQEEHAESVTKKEIHTE